ncbi:MAG: lipoprotein-releasing system ATP-binding protein [Crocinitomicaceae bacterium]|jgi:lipoprotein-releasing system ATP-binding protein
MSKALEAKNINKYFRKPVEFHVLKDISMDIEQGEFVSVMGKSGCGKSTLLYILSTMDTDYEGELYLNDKLITGRTADELAQLRNEKIGFVFQFHYLLAEFTVLENVMLPAKKLGKKSYEEIEHDAMLKLELLGIKDQALKLSSRISGGQKQRVAIARSLINDPVIIMGDEPTGNLDSKNADIIFNIFKDLTHEQGLSLLIVTHDDDFAQRTDRIITMEDGLILS